MGSLIRFPLGVNHRSFPTPSPAKVLHGPIARSTVPADTGEIVVQSVEYTRPNDPQRIARVEGVKPDPFLPVFVADIGAQIDLPEITPPQLGKGADP